MHQYSGQDLKWSNSGLSWINFDICPVHRLGSIGPVCIEGNPSSRCFVSTAFVYTNGRHQDFRLCFVSVALILGGESLSQSPGKIFDCAVSIKDQLEQRSVVAPPVMATMLCLIVAAELRCLVFYHAKNRRLEPVACVMGWGSGRDGKGSACSCRSCNDELLFLCCSAKHQRQQDASGKRQLCQRS